MVPRPVAAPNTGFDAYMGTVRSAGAQPVVIANYGSGTPQEAAEWVRCANVTKGYGVNLCEVGNEVYGISLSYAGFSPGGNVSVLQWQKGPPQSARPHTILKVR